MVNEGKRVAPSVTTILDVVGKPALENWKIDQHLEQAHKAGDYGSNVDLQDYIKEIKRLTQDRMDRALRS